MPTAMVSARLVVNRILDDLSPVAYRNDKPEETNCT
jgi:hypothetical protein